MPSYSGFYDKSYFEPAMACAVGAGIGYTSSEDSDRILNAGLYCAGGAVLGMVLNSYYREKVDSVREAELNNLKREVNRHVTKQAHRANSGDMSKPYNITVQQLEEGHEDAAGNIISPSIKTKLVKP